jgi:hypothetical protein
MLPRLSALSKAPSYSRSLSKVSSRRVSPYWSRRDINVENRYCTSANPLLKENLEKARFFPMEAQRKVSVSKGSGAPDGLPHRSSIGAENRPMADNSASAVPQSPKSPKAMHARKISTSAAKQDSKPAQPAKKDTAGKGSEATAGKSSQSPTELPDFIIHRNQLFEELKKKHDAEMVDEPHPEIEVTVDVGKGQEMQFKGKAWETTPGSFLRHVDKEISSDVVVAKVNGKELWDLDRPLEYGCKVSYLPFSSAEGRNVFWHSSAHVLGEAAECNFNCLLSHGPPVEQGFFYDMAIADG